MVIGELGVRYKAWLAEATAELLRREDYGFDVDLSRTRPLATTFG
jgi:hypothetical protein